MPRDRPHLWESFKRALGSPRGEAPDAEVPPPVADEGPPFLAPDERLAVPPAALPAPEPGANEIERGPEPASEPNVAEEHDERPTPAPPAPEVAAPRSAGLARGLASFSRDNADREKKFRHILSDGDAGGKKKR